jgi:peptidoglycan/LPS O-acetylase OafA/YrhL
MIVAGIQQHVTELEGRVPSLDGLRAVSILMVVLTHAAQTCRFHAPSWLPEWAWWLFNGQLGVCIFFVISGFIITLLLLKEESRSGTFSIRNFYIRRAWRILPVYLIFIFTVFIINWFADLKIPGNDFLAALTFTTWWWGEPAWMLGHTWSLSVEEQFYLLWPVTLFIVKTKTARYRLLAFGVIIFPLIRVLVYLSPLSEQRPFLSITQGDSILAGCALAVFLFYEGEKTVRWLKSFSAVATIACLAVIFMSTALQVKMMWGMLTVPLANLLQSLSIAWIVGILIFNKGLPYKLLNSRLFIFAGTISYSWYLWQQLFLFSCDRYFQSDWFNFPVNIALSFVAAIISYYGIERVFQRPKVYFEGQHSR